MITLTVVVERKHPELPRYAVVPAHAIASWNLGKRTTPIDIRINGRDAAARNIKYWDTERWFISITKKDCKAFGIDTGSRIELEIRKSEV